MLDSVHLVAGAGTWAGAVLTGIILAYLSFRFGRRSAVSDRLLDSYGELIREATQDVKYAQELFAHMHFAHDRGSEEDGQWQQQLRDLLTRLADARRELRRLSCVIGCLEREKELRDAVDTLCKLHEDRPVLHWASHERGIPANRDEFRGAVEGFDKQIETICALVRQKYGR